MQRLSYDLFNQTVRLMKVMSRQTLFCFNAAFICNVWKGANVQISWNIISFQDWYV